MKPAIDRLRWIRRRARRLQRFYGVPRNIAVVDAALDYEAFIGGGNAH